MNFVKYHLIPILAIIAFVYVFTLFLKVKKEISIKEIGGKQNSELRIQENYVIGKSAEINFLASLANKKNVSLLGSSELANSEMQYMPYFFLPDSLNFSVQAFGHAFHQCFSIYAQLLAAEPFLKNSNICIILSPGWFETEGTNVESFLEFVPDNFLRSIIHNKNISSDDKLEVANYIRENYDLIDQPSLSLKYFNHYAKFSAYPMLAKWLEIFKNEIDAVKYNVELANLSDPYPLKEGLVRKKLQTDFVNSIHSNNMYINDVYYNTYLNNSTSAYSPGKINEKKLKRSRELYDFKLLVSLLKKYNCKASFIFQPLNSFHYKGLEKYKSVKTEVIDLLKKNNFPCLDLFNLTNKEFEPAVLNDIMHMGDYGWTKVNQFIYSTYYESIIKK